jgi:MFS family permease
MLVGAAAAQAAVSFIVIGLPSIGPQIGQRFGLSLPALGALLATMQLGSGVALIAAGRAVDRWGSRLATRGGTFLAACGLMLGAGVNTTAAVFVGLFLAGLGSAIVPVAGANAIFRVYPPERRAWALGVRQMAVPVGGMIAAVAVPGLNELAGTRAVLAVGAVAIALIGAGFSSVSDDLTTTHDASVRIVRGVWKGPGLRRLLIVTLTYIFVLQTVLVYTVPAMHAAGFSRLDAGIAYFVVNATAIVSRLAWGRIADGRGGTRRKRALIETGYMASAGALVFGLALHATLPLVLLAVGFYGFAALGWNAVVYTIAGEWAGPERAGRAFAASATVVFSASALVNPVIGALADSAGWNAVWIAAAVVALVGTAAATSLPDYVTAGKQA